MTEQQPIVLPFPRLSHPPTLEEALQYTWLILRLYASDDPELIVEIGRSVLRRKGFAGRGTPSTDLTP